MIRHLIVPIDGSPESWRAFDVAVGIARRCSASIRLVEVEYDPCDVPRADRRLNEELARRAPIDVDVSLDIRLTHDSVASQIEAVERATPSSIIVMSSQGRGRSAAIVGSVTQDVLRRISGPLVLVGPNASTDLADGPVVVTVDGSPESEIAIPVAVAWADLLHTATWIVTAADPAAGWMPDDVLESGYLVGLAAHIREASGQEVNFDVLHDSQPVRAVLDDAARRSASLIVASSHGRGASSRALLGSVTSDFVRRAPCPVIVVQP